MISKSFRFTLKTFFIFSLMHMIGCGSGEEPKKPVAHQMDKKVEKKPETVAIPKSREKLKKEKKEKAKEKFKGNPDDLFSETSPQPNFQVMDSTEDNGNKFLASVPPDDFGLSSYQILDAPRLRRAVSRSSNNLPEGFSPLPEFGYAEDGMPLRIYCELDESEMAYIPAGVAVIGSKKGPRETTPELAIELDPYYIDVTEVTVGQFQKFIEESPASKGKVKEEQSNLGGPSDHPILGVKWYEARKYALWAGKKLPREAEWERAARGTEGFLHVWGNGRPTWSQPRLVDQITSVQTYPTDKSPEGVFDLAGNAMEWCNDYYDSNAFSEVFTDAAGTVIKNWPGPKKPEERRFRVVKGNGPNWELWSRQGESQDERNPQIGFRCVLRLDNSETEEEDDEET